MDMKLSDDRKSLVVLDCEGNPVEGDALQAMLDNDEILLPSEGDDDDDDDSDDDDESPTDASSSDGDDAGT